MKYKKFYIALLSISILILCLSCGTVEKKKQVEKLETRIEFNPISEYRGEGDVTFEALIQSNIGQPTARLNFQVNGVPNYRDLVLTGENRYSCEIPRQEKGTAVKYFLEITTPSGSKIYFPQNAEEEGKYYTLVFKGKYNKFLWSIHVALTIIAIILFVVAAYFAFKHIRSGYPISKTLWLGVTAFLLFFLGIFPIGMIVEYQVFGTVWDGWPFGSDFTNTKAFILFIYWLATLFMVKNSIFKKEEKNLIADRVFASLVIIGAIVTVALFIVPHKNVIF